jgi:hypothetical protein
LEKIRAALDCGDQAETTGRGEATAGNPADDASEFRNATGRLALMRAGEAVNGSTLKMIVEGAGAKG